MELTSLIISVSKFLIGLLICVVQNVWLTTTIEVVESCQLNRKLIIDSRVEGDR